jgi:hypothetical protein
MSRLIYLFVSMLLAVPVLAGDMTKIQVKVTNLKGKPVDRASVVVRFIEGRSVAKLGKQVKTQWETRTNQEGLAKIPEIPQGKILFQVIARGYQTYGETVEINDDEKTVEIQLKPPQPQYSAH